MAIAANAGDPDAQFRLAALYQAGRGVPQDDVSAFKWTRAAAVQGHLEAQVQLGALYQMGRGVERDDKEARLWLTKAAERGSEQAAKLLVESDSNASAARSSRAPHNTEDGWRTTWWRHTSTRLKSSAGVAMVGPRSWMLPGVGKKTPFVHSSPMVQTSTQPTTTLVRPYPVPRPPDTRAQSLSYSMQGPL